MEIMSCSASSKGIIGPQTNPELQACIQWKEILDKPPKGNQSQLCARWELCKDNEVIEKISGDRTIEVNL